MKKYVISLIAAAAAGTVMADATPYAKVVSVSGNVTVAAKSQMIPATAGMVLTQGSSVLPSSTGVATVQFASGCTALVKSGEMMPVQESACSALHASTKTVVGSGGSQATGGLGGGLAGVPLPGLIAGGVLLTVGIHDATKGGGGGAAPSATPPAQTPVAVVTPVRRPARPISGS